MKYAFGLFLLASLSSAAILRAAVDPALKAITPDDDPSYHAPPDVPGLPRVLLLGDSISIGYTLPVRERLRGIANVHRPAENCGPTKLGLAHLDQWLGSGHWDLIHFNFGLHDLKYVDAEGNVADVAKGRQLAAPAEYEKNLRTLVARLQKTGAVLIFATTTPVPSGTGFRVEGDERRYNQVAREVMRENGIAIDDLCAFVVPRQAAIQLPHNVHFTPEGCQELAVAVAASIKAGLGNSPNK